MTRLASRFGTANLIRRDRPLTREELFRVVPSVFSEDKHESRSERYTYIPTISLLGSLQQEGFQPFFACQTRVPDEQRIRFWPQHFGAIPQWITLEPRIFAWMDRFCDEYLDNQNQLIAHETLFSGTINRTEVHPREVVKRVLHFNAAAVILAHNHPSGETTPSQADKALTQRLVQVLQLVDIRVPDHLIVGGRQIYSFAEHGLL